MRRPTSVQTLALGFALLILAGSAVPAYLLPVRGVHSLDLRRFHRRHYNVNILVVKSGNVVVPLADPKYRFGEDAHIIAAGDKEAGIRLMNLH